MTDNEEPFVIEDFYGERLVFTGEDARQMREEMSKWVPLDSEEGQRMLSRIDEFVLDESEDLEDADREEAEEDEDAADDEEEEDAADENDDNT